ncbi:LAFA_0A01508g1_1 [Lachancea sp. 'fantastica']|nr:LAFA_0A01508g1_1 [Lachancea sp. 'fantastica']
MAVQDVIRKKSKAHGDPVARQKLMWVVGHGMTLGLGAIYALFYLWQCLTMYRYRSWKTLFLIARPPQVKSQTWLQLLWRSLPQISYRLSLVGVLLAYSVASYQKWYSLNPSWYDLLSRENFQGVLIAVLWLFSRASLFKLVPFILTSFLHLTVKADQKADVKKDDDKDDEKRPLNDNEDKKTKQKDNTTTFLHIIAYSELVTVVSLFFDIITFRDGVGGFVLVIYLSIYWLRLNFSPYAQETLLRLILKVDKKIPPKYHSQWKDIKQFLYLRMDESRKQG